MQFDFDGSHSSRDEYVHNISDRGWTNDLSSVASLSISNPSILIQALIHKVIDWQHSFVMRRILAIHTTHRTYSYSCYSYFLITHHIQKKR